MSLAANNPSALAADPRNDGKVAIVTGASAGIGAGIAIELAKAGFTKFALVARNAEKLAEVEAACKAAGAKEVLVLQKDLFKPDEVCQDIIEKTVERFGRLDLLVNNAGIGFRKAIRDINPEEYDQRMNVHVKTPMFLTKHALPHLEKTKGNVVFISSIIGPEIVPKEASIYA